MKKSLQFLALVLFSIHSYAQSEQKILLKNHSITIEKSLEEGLQPLLSEQNQAYIYRIVQFNTVDFVKLGDANTQYSALEYIPKMAYLMKVSATDKTVAATLKSKGATGALALQPEWKLSKRLFTENIPEWAFTKDNQVRIWVRYYEGVSHSQVVAQLKTQYKVTGENESENIVEVTLSPSKIKSLATLPYIYYVQEMEDPGQTENYTGRTDHRSNSLQSSYPGAPAYDGTGVLVGHGDDGRIGPHIDFTGRMTQPTAGASTGDHGDHVAGIIFGAGNLDPTGKGNAPGAEIYYQSYPDNLNDADQNYSGLGVRVTVSSYSNGCNAGYTNFTRQMDQDAIDNPNMIHVFSAGNSGTSNCGYGAGNLWGNVTGGHKIAKNVIAVANLNASDIITTSSSRGPAEDGRIKPDVAAVGSNVYSTTDPNLYTFKTGTSMSCPGVGGVMAILYEAYKDHNAGVEPKTGLIKAILMNTCDDLGNPGPDFIYGYGRVNTRRAYGLIESQSYITNTITNGATKTFQIPVPNNTAEARIMLYWPDLPASTVAQYALVNDLDMEIDFAGTNYKPWVLDPTPVAANLNANAVRAVDSLNNIEQITINNPGTGDITVTVDGSNIPGSAQEFYIVYEFVKDEIVLTYPVGGEEFVPGETEMLRWDAPEGNTTFGLEYSTDAGTTWSVISNSISAGSRFFNWNVPNTIDGNYKIRLTRGGQTDVSPGVFTVVNTPPGLAFSSSCPDSITLTWNPVNGATGYIVYKLGAKYMDSVTTTLTTFAKVPQSLGLTEWYSVAAMTQNNGVGRRAFAIEKAPAGVFNCALDDDLSVSQILSPITGNMPSCFNISTVPVTIRLENLGVNPVFNFDVSYLFNNGTSVTQTVTDTIPVGGTLDYTFTGSIITLSVGASSTLSVWAQFNDDDNYINDSIGTDIDIYAGMSVSFPYSHDFENFSLCGTNNDCGATTCTLANGWNNSTNGTHDVIDWRTNDGPTASGSTGPPSDHTLGTSSGKYLYLEASGNCDSSLAILQSPCIDLTGTISPQLEFWYHMNGADMGILSVDVFNGTEWALDRFKISGNQGSSWNLANVSLIDFIGKTIVLRFRGKTGSDFTSDIAIDDINLSENTSAPSSAFGVNSTITCIDGIIELMDQSTNVPTSWEWSVSPSTYAFVNGTDSSYQNPSVQFSAPGLYTITLITMNANGSDTLSINQFINVDPGTPIPVFEDFEGTFTPSQWSIDNPDGLSQWQVRTVTGSDGNTTRAASFDNFNAINLGENDGLVTLNLDLRTAVNPMLYFDVAYAPKSLTSGDSLILDISTNCGSDYIRSSYQKGVATLATTAAQSGYFSPSQSGEWRRDSLDLSAYIGSNIKVRFRNYSNGSNAVFIDNVNIVNSAVMAPVAFINIADTLICRNINVVFNDSITGGSGSSFLWDFGQNAIPRTANTAGPHTIRYVTTGTYEVKLTVVNDGGISVRTLNIHVAEKPLAVFSETFQTVQTVQFNDLTINDPTDWLWDFGDGNTSTLQNPLHTYAVDSNYTVLLTATNRCGFATRTRNVVVHGIGIQEVAVGLSELGLYPNPSTGLFTLSFTSLTSDNVTIEILDLSGRKIKNIEKESRIGSNQVPLDLKSYAEGVYLIRINTPTGSKTLRAIKE